MEAELKGISSLFGDFLPDEYIPDGSCFYISLILRIGPKDENGADYFDVHICSLDWVKYNITQPILLRYTIIVEEYDFDQILNTIQECINKSDGESWDEISRKLSRYFYWEFEDYYD